MTDLKRSVDVVEGGSVGDIEYNNDAGAKKTIEVGPSLEYVSVTTAEVRILPGTQLFLFKTTTGLGWVELAEVSGIGAVGTAPAANTFPVQGQVYTQIAASTYKYIKGSSAIHLYILKDSSKVRVKA